MKKSLAIFAALALVFASFVSCEKDDNESATNYIKITGTFTVEDKTYENPTFDLGSPTDHIGYVQTNIPLKNNTVSNMIRIMPVNNIDLGNNIVLNYDYSVYSDVVGTWESDAYIQIYLNDGKSGFWIYSNDLTTTITKVGEVGGYIEGNYEGTFFPDRKNVETYPVKGKFKVKRMSYVPD